MAKQKKAKLMILLLMMMTLLLPVYSSVHATAPQKPFPQHSVYANGVIKPSHVTQAIMDQAVQAKWNAWKSAYLKQAGAGKYIVEYNDQGETVSEAHGYGMVLAVIMAGYDTNAKAYYDGMYQYYKEHPSENNPYLMAWKQNSSYQDIEGANSATDGDMDIAYSLLLADKQWGSDGAIPYLQEGISMINAIMDNDVNQAEWTLRLGDWATSGSYNTATRPSDFMLNHMKAFEAATGDARWTNVINKTYSIIQTIYANNSAATGLLPDFVVLKNGVYKPASAGFLEGPNDGYYYYNACRTPWRIATDYIVSGDTRALNLLTNLNSYIQTKTTNKPQNIRDGYKLSGSTLGSYNSGAFYAPFGVSAMTSSVNQAWLNKLWDHTVNSAPELYYEDSIRLFSMLVMSGNWWTP
ncbi:glycosyl hydrolase family 8 [Paenibacillus aquistagni]|uniref:Glucanase n=1 Tax=Paenibacillus aquistagni TaxID=1852522 RepID=A0A1X7IVH6_9BACL|nr:glycosyl hydrolase family 8 [Paenibacillus aquistagni]SMG18922.1 Endo-1,4-beta-D-glucanase Y [Paenibacillus aquistagni]